MKSSCNYVALILIWTAFIANTMLGVIMIARLYAMYQRSRRMLIFLVVIFMTVTITFVVMTVIGSSYVSAEALILSGTFQCHYGDDNFMTLNWLLCTVWEILALCLAIWISVKHLREMSRPSIGWSVGGIFEVLISSHVHYFAAFATSSCLNLFSPSSSISNLSSVGVQVYYGIFQVAIDMQIFVLGPRLLMTVRRYHAKLVDNPDAGACVTTIAFEEQLHTSTWSDVDV